jgi:transposase
MTPYSIDLRKRVLVACDRREQTITEIAKQFQVSRRWIEKLRKRRTEFGTIAPAQRTQGRKSAFVGDMLNELDELVKCQCDITLAEIKKHFAGRVNCSLQAIANNLKRLGWGYKKNRYMRLSKTEKMLD